MSKSASLLILMGAIVVGSPGSSALAARQAHAVASRRSVYVVTDQTTLGEVSILLYGTTRKWREIARHNRLRPPYRIRIGQRLKLPYAPIPAAEGRRALLAMWLKRFAVDAEQADKKAADAPRAPEIAAQVQQRVVTSFKTAPVEPEEHAQVQVEASAQELLNRGKEAMSKNDPRKAAEHFRESRDKNPGELPAWVLEIKALRASGQGDEAREVIDELLKIHPQAAGLPFLQEGS